MLSLAAKTEGMHLPALLEVTDYFGFFFNLLLLFPLQIARPF